MAKLRSRLFIIGGLVLLSVWALIPADTTQRVRDATTGRMKDTTIRRVPLNLGLDLQGGIHLALEVDQSKGPVPDPAEAIHRAERVVRTRIDEFGTTEPVVQVVGNDRLIVELAGEKDPARAKGIIQRTAFLEFRITDMKNLFRDALPEIDKTLRRAGVKTPGQGGAAANVTQLFGADTGKGKAKNKSEKSKAAAKDTTELNAPGPLASLLYQGQLPGEFLVPEEQVPVAESLLARPEVQRLIPRGMSRCTSSRASRLSATGTCSSGTRNSPGSWPWYSSEASGPGALSSVVSFAAALLFSLLFLAFPLPVSAPNSCVTLAAAPAWPGVFTPARRSVLSISGRASRNRFFISVMRNSRNAVRWMMPLARAGSFSPASSTINRSLPTTCTTGSVVPNSSIRVRTTRSARWIASAGSGTGPFDWSTSKARWIPPCRSRPRLSGTRRIVVSFIRPVVASRTRWVVTCKAVSTWPWRWT